MSLPADGRSWSLTGRPAVVGFFKESPGLQDSSTDRLIAALDIEKHRLTRERLEGLHLLRALRLAPDLETCEAILRGERVPRSRLDPQGAKAYGLSRSAPNSSTTDRRET